MWNLDKKYIKVGLILPTQNIKQSKSKILQHCLDQMIRPVPIILSIHTRHVVSLPSNTYCPCPFDKVHYIPDNDYGLVSAFDSMLNMSHDRCSIDKYNPFLE